MKQTIIALLLLFACASVGQAQENGTLTLSHPLLTLSTPRENIQSVTLEDGKLVLVVVIQPAATGTLTVYCSGGCDFRRLEKRIYAARDGQIVLEQVIPGRIVPAQAERFEFEEEAPKVGQYKMLHVVPGSGISIVADDTSKTITITNREKVKK